jgi:hypothetical protein
LTVFSTIDPGRSGSVSLTRTLLRHHVQRLAAGQRCHEPPPVLGRQHPLQAGQRLRIVVDDDHVGQRRLRGDRPLSGLRPPDQAVLQVNNLLGQLAHLAQELLVRLGHLFQQRVALAGRLELGRRLDHALAQVGDDLWILQDHVDRPAAKRLHRRLERPPGAHDDDRRQRRLVAREVQELEPPTRRRRVDVQQSHGEELVQDLIARPHRIGRAGHDQPDAGQEPVQALDHLLVAVDDQDLLPRRRGVRAASHTEKLTRFAPLRE